ncbi:hypothetical protein Q8A73_012878 [Channa argus]|nr:hypothetical protein Q8A73_012878 [Channa argus]
MESERPLITLGVRSGEPDTYFQGQTPVWTSCESGTLDASVQHSLVLIVQDGMPHSRWMRRAYASTGFEHWSSECGLCCTYHSNKMSRQGRGSTKEAGKHQLVPVDVVPQALPHSSRQIFLIDPPTTSPSQMYSIKALEVTAWPPSRTTAVSHGRSRQFRPWITEIPSKCTP